MRCWAINYRRGERGANAIGGRHFLPLVLLLIYPHSYLYLYTLAHMYSPYVYMTMYRFFWYSSTVLAAAAAARRDAAAAAFLLCIKEIDERWGESKRQSRHMSVCTCVWLCCLLSDQVSMGPIVDWSVDSWWRPPVIVPWANHRRAIALRFRYGDN